MKKINILHVVASNKYSGAEKVVEQICMNINQEIFNVIVICNGGDLLNKFKKNNLEVHEINVSNYFISNLINFKKLVIKNQIDIVHAHDNRASLFSLLCKNIFGLNYKIISHIQITYNWLTGINLFKLIDRITRNRYSINILCGKYLYDYYIKYGKYIDRNKIVVLPNSIEIQLNSFSDNYDIRKSFKINESDTIIGFVGRLHKNKGLLPFFSELPLYDDIMVNSKILIVGSGDEEIKLKKIINSIKQGDKIIFVGYEENPIKLINQFDILILPSIIEGLPLVILEAMSLSKCVVAFNVGSISEIIDDGQNGYIIEPGNYSLFFERIIELTKDKDKARLMGKRAFEKVKNNYNLVNYITNIEKLYTSLSEKHKNIQFN